MTGQLMLDLSPAPPAKPLRLEQARVLLLLADRDESAPWDLTIALRLSGLSLYERGWVASRLSELVRSGCVEECGRVDGPVGRPETVYRVTAFGRSRLDEARRTVEASK